MPVLSIIVCTFNREIYIEKTLDCLQNQSQKKEDYEVLIIDNNSTDNTASICRNFIDRNHLQNFHYFLEKNQGHTFARNMGIQEAKGEYIAFLDDDAMVELDYCAEIIRYFESNPGVMVIGGKITPVFEGNCPSWMSRYLWPLVAGLDLGDKVIEFKHSKYPIGANMAFRSIAFKNYGYFNTDLGRRGGELEGGDEKDMIYRLKLGGEKAYYVPSIHVRHIIPESRMRIPYIKGQATGVGTSEKKRLAKADLMTKSKKFIEEALKIAATFALAAYYLLTFKPSKGLMLVRFRIWVIQGYLRKFQ